jgi:predicted AAA+ superfamily ATPase
LDYEISFWRTKSGTEVDFILGGGEVAVEVKGSRGMTGKQLRSLVAFRDEHSPSKTMVVCNESEERVAGNIRIVPWRKFLQQLWAGDIIRWGALNPI